MRSSSGLRPCNVGLVLSGVRPDRIIYPVTDEEMARWVGEAGRLHDDLDGGGVTHSTLKNSRMSDHL